MHMKLDDITAISLANKITGGGAAVGFFGFLSQINWVGLGGFLVTLLSFAFSAYMQIRREHRERRTSREREERRECREAREHEARLQAIRDRCGP